MGLNCFGKPVDFLHAKKYIFYLSQIEGVYNDQDFRAKVTRSELEEMCKDLFERVADPITQALKSSSVTLVSRNRYNRMFFNRQRYFVTKYFVLY